MAPMVSSRLVSVQVKGGSCVVYSSTIWYSIRVVFRFGLWVSFWMVMAFPVAFASAHAMALLRRQPTCSCVFGFLLVSWQTPASMLPVISMVIVLFSVCISASSASSVPSMRSFGRTRCTWARSVFVNETPSCLSNSCDRAKPGGVRNTPSLRLGSSFSVISSGLGRGVFGVSGINMRLDSMFVRFFGGR